MPAMPGTNVAGRPMVVGPMSPSGPITLRREASFWKLVDCTQLYWSTAM